MSTGEIQLLIENISVDYSGAIVALSGVSLDMRVGEIVALLGANGAGKSTTLKAVSNLLPAERGRVVQGQIRFDGVDATHTRPGELVRRGLVPVLEGRHCFPRLTIEENLITGGLGRRATRAEIAHDLDRVYALFPRLATKRRSPAGLTSGGEQQMAAIGRALMARPRLLVLDEPSMGLAPMVVEDIFKTLKSLNSTDGLSILVAEQNSTVALRHADRAFVIENGRVVLDGAAAALRERDDVKAFYLGLATPHRDQPGTAAGT